MTYIKTIVNRVRVHWCGFMGHYQAARYYRMLGKLIERRMN